MDGLTLCRRRSVQPAGCCCLTVLAARQLWYPSFCLSAHRVHGMLTSQRSSRAGSGVGEGLGCGGHCSGGVLSLCFSRSLKKLVGARDQVSSHSCVVPRGLWVDWQDWRVGQVDRPMLGLRGVPKMSIDDGMPRMALAHVPGRHAMIPGSMACQPQPKSCHVSRPAGRALDGRAWKV